MMRIVDVVFALPDLLMIILITVLMGRGVMGIFIALTLVSWVTVARLVRGEVLRIKELTYIRSRSRSWSQPYPDLRAGNFSEYHWFIDCYFELSHPGGHPRGIDPQLYRPWNFPTVQQLGDPGQRRLDGRKVLSASDSFSFTGDIFYYSGLQFSWGGSQGRTRPKGLIWRNLSEMVTLLAVPGHYFLFSTSLLI